MISSETPYKLADIIRDTWPQLYRPFKIPYNKEKNPKMKRYNSEDYFSVINKNTGKKIADCAQQEDALMLVSFDPQNRTITTNKFLMGQVVDVVMPKALPTSEIAINPKPYQDHRDAWMVEKINQLPQIKLPDRQQEPFTF
jgi:hypothetical protein